MTKIIKKHKTDTHLSKSDVDDKILHLDKKARETLVALLSSKTLSDAARLLGVERSTIYDRIEKYQLQELLDTIPSRALSVLKHGSVRAAEVMVEELDIYRGQKLEAAKEILDRVGVTSKKQGDTMGVSLSDNTKEVKIIVTRGN